MSGQPDKAGWNLSLPPEVWAILSIALILRLAFIFHLQGMDAPIHYDGELYLALAEGIRNGVFSMFHPLDIPETTRMPGYPILIRLFRSQSALLIFQSIISAGKIPLLFLVLREFKIERSAIAKIAMLLLAIEPMDIILSGSLLTESLSSFFVLLGFLLLLRRGSFRNAVFIGIVFAAFAYLRPNGLHLGMLASLFLLLRTRTSAMKAITCAAVLILSMLPWVLRNHAVDGRFHLSDSGNVVAAHFHVPDVLSRTDPALAVQYRNELRQLAETTDWADRKSFKIYFVTIGKKVHAALFAHPIDWAVVQVQKAVRILVAPGRGHMRMFFNGSPATYTSILVVSIAFSTLAMAICVLAIIRIRRSQWEEWLLIATVLFILLSAAISTPDARFKNPATPLILLLGAASLEKMRSRESATDRGNGRVSPFS